MLNNTGRFLVLLTKADALLLTSQVSRRYCAGYDICEGMAIVSSAGCRYFTDSRYIEDAKRNLPDFDVRMVDREHNYLFRIGEACTDWGIRSIGYEEEYLTAGELIRMKKALPAEFVEMQEEISNLRMVKDEDELSAIRAAQQITDKTFQDILNYIKPDITEKDLYRELIYLLYKNGGEEPAFTPVVVSGPNTSMPHGVAGERAFCAGDFITLDFGCKVQGYCSDMTRTVALRHVTDEMHEVYNTVLAAQSAALNITKAGLSGAEIDMAARRVIEDAGYGSYFGHGYGHGVGLEIHEKPNCSPSWQTPLPAGCVCSAEPGIYLPNKFGVRIEDLVIIRENGHENLTQSPKSLIIL